MPSMRKYKMRAECIVDVGNFVKLIPAGRVVITSCDIDGNWIPDVDVSFTSPWTLERIREEILEIQDGHCMYRTVAPAAKYTGEQYHFEGV